MSGDIFIGELVLSNSLPGSSASDSTRRGHWTSVGRTKDKPRLPQEQEEWLRKV